MYRVIVVITGFAFMAVKAKAQQQIFEIGLEGGYGTTSLRGNSIIEEFHHSKTSFSTGFFVQYPINKFISVKAISGYQQKGSSYIFGVIGMGVIPVYETIHGQERFDYLDNMLLIRISYGKALKCFFNTGPFIGILLRHTSHSDATGSFPEVDTHNTSSFRTTDIGLCSGLGLSYTIKHKYSLSLEVRNNLGLANI